MPNEQAVFPALGVIIFQQEKCIFGFTGPAIFGYRFIRLNYEYQIREWRKLF